jgi:hypothetical protein
VLYRWISSTDTCGFQFHEDLVRLHGTKLNFYKLKWRVQLWHYDSFLSRAAHRRIYSFFTALRAPSLIHIFTPTHTFPLPQLVQAVTLLLQPLWAEGWKRLRNDKEYVFPKVDDCFRVMMNTLRGYLSRRHKVGRGEVGLKPGRRCGKAPPDNPAHTSA